MSEHSDEHGILADITSVAAFLSGSIGSFSKEVVGHIARELISADSLLPEKRSESEEQAEDGLVVKRVTKNEDGNWQIESEHPAWPSVPWDEGNVVIGEVRWAVVTF